MRFLTPCRGLLVVLFAAAVLGSSAAGDDKDEGFKPLFNGKDFTGWKTFLDPKAKNADAAKTWTISNGEIHCSGQPNGYFYTEKPYKNYVIRYDWKYIEPPQGGKSTYNSGLLVHMQDQKIWPKSIEVQGANKNHGFLIFIGFKGTTSKYDQAAKDKATKPIGEWNTTETTCKADGSIVAKINGTEVASGKSELTEGPIAFQSEGAEIHFRNIKIKELK